MLEPHQGNRGKSGDYQVELVEHGCFTSSSVEFGVSNRAFTVLIALLNLVAIADEKAANMANTEGLRVTVQGDLPAEVMKRVSDAVRQAVLDAVAEVDMAPALQEQPFDRTDGIWFRSEES
ncbi:hypothetical protein [Streptomyces nojiriensis]|uniref:hypothetical protein n=1 Tax=Streptomyces nojiriensis TaxID=66374 RepID=UPI00364AC588